MAENIQESKDYLPQMPQQRITSPGRIQSNISFVNENPPAAEGIAAQAGSRLLPPIFGHRRNNQVFHENATESVEESRNAISNPQIEQEEEDDLIGQIHPTQPQSQNTPPDNTTVADKTSPPLYEKCNLLDLEHDKDNKEQKPTHKLKPFKEKAENADRDVLLPNLSDLPRTVRFNLIENQYRLKPGKKDGVNRQFVTNKIRTARYNFFTFLPIALLIQYTKLGNVFWTIQTALQFNPKISTQNPFLVMLLILAILIIGMLKEWLSDHKRSVADKEVNDKLNRRIVSVNVAKKSMDALSEARR